MAASSDNIEEGPWNPGLSSEIPPRLMPQVTLYRSENSAVDFKRAQELSDLVGLPLEDLISLKAERLIIHELLIRVTADLSVPDGPNYEDLGINLRGMVDRIFKAYVLPELSQFDELLEKIRAEATAFTIAELSATVFLKSSQKKEPSSSWIGRLFALNKKKEKTSKKTTLEQRAMAAISEWQFQVKSHPDPLKKATLEALERIIGAIIGHRGRLINDSTLIAQLVSAMVGNNHGSVAIGSALVPFIERAVKAEGYCFLPAQQKPVIMNVKGASASGKSTIRNQQRALAERIGISWDDFALISPDYWRKYLLDYDSLGDDFKYVAMLTGRELEIIDKKLDRYMAEKAVKKTISHLLIDRFRFDSFAPQKMVEADSRLLTRFGDTVYLFFMITSPEETVERAWSRGLTTGRYKAVDDLLYHNIEAYTGMPQLFFSWATSCNKRVHYEFLDNDVPKGERPRTVAFGWNGDMTILDLDVMMKVETFKHINIEARTREEVYPAGEIESGEATFLVRCAETIPRITLASQKTAKPYAHLSEGTCVWCDPCDDALIDKALVAFKLDKCKSAGVEVPSLEDLRKEQQVTVGTWGPASEP